MEVNCRYPGCINNARKSFALVPLCNRHNDEVRMETARYYAKRIQRHEREQYNEIESLTPWFRMEKRKRK